MTMSKENMKVIADFMVEGSTQEERLLFIKINEMDDAKVINELGHTKEEINQKFYEAWIAKATEKRLAKFTKGENK